MTTRSTLAITGTVIASLVACGSALAGSPLAQYSQTPGDSGYSLTYRAGMLTTTGGAYPTQFSFRNEGLPAENLAAAFALNAKAEGPAYQTTAFGHTYDAQDFTGSFSFVYTGRRQLIIGDQSYRAGSVLLAGTFSDAILFGQDSGSTGSMTDSRFAGGTLDFTSGFQQTTADQSLSIALNAVSPCWCIRGTELSDFSATSVGSFGADGTIMGGSGVPEGSAWVTMILGCGLAGAQIRRRDARAANGLKAPHPSPRALS